MRPLTRSETGVSIVSQAAVFVQGHETALQKTCGVVGLSQAAPCASNVVIFKLT